MPSLLIAYHSNAGHIAALADAIAQGARDAGATVTLGRVSDSPTAPDNAPPVLTPDDLPRHDGILFGAPTHFGAMAAEMKLFLDRCSGLWLRHALVGKVAGVFTSSDSQHGGQEHTLLSMQASLQHLGLVIAGLPYTFQGQTRMDEITGGTPYGATTLARAADGTSRPPSANELAGARFQGAHVARLATALVSGREHACTDALPAPV